MDKHLLKCQQLISALALVVVLNSGCAENRAVTEPPNDGASEILN